MGKYQAPNQYVCTIPNAPQKATRPRVPAAPGYPKLLHTKGIALPDNRLLTGPELQYGSSLWDFMQYLCPQFQNLGMDPGVVEAREGHTSYCRRGSVEAGGAGVVQNGDLQLGWFEG